MIKINERFSMSRDGNGWTLIETKHGTRIDPLEGEISTTSERRRFFPDLEQTMQMIVDLSAPDVLSGSVALAITKIEELKQEILTAIERSKG